MSEERQVWVYWVSRDSIDGNLAGACALWYSQPVRCKHRHRVTWVPKDPFNAGLHGFYTIEQIEQWFRVKPDTDLELIKIEQWSRP